MTELVHRTTGGTVQYPESDGQPMAETEIHGDWMMDVKMLLRRRYADRPDVHIGSNLLLYFVEGDPTKSLSPDVYVTFGMDKAPRRTYLVWVEGKAPDVVFEMTSASTRRRDLGAKKRIYESLGVREYVLYDPLAEYLDPPLMGFQLVDEGQPDAHYTRLDGPPLTSDVLDLTLELDAHGALVLRDRLTGDDLVSDAERADEEASRAEREAARAEREAARAKREAARAKREAARAERAEAELERLRALLAEEGDEKV